MPEMQVPGRNGGPTEEEARGAQDCLVRSSMSDDDGETLA